MSENDWGFLDKLVPVQKAFDSVSKNCVPDVAETLRDGSFLAKYLSKLNEEGLPLPPPPQIQ